VGAGAGAPPPDEGPLHLAGSIAAAGKLQRSFGPQNTRALG
jgi:hypothetical protein